MWLNGDAVHDTLRRRQTNKRPIRSETKLWRISETNNNYDKTMQGKVNRHSRWKIKISVLICFLVVTVYVWILPILQPKPVVPVEDYIDMNELQREIEEDKPIKILSYKEVLEKYDTNVNAPFGPGHNEDDNSFPYGNTMKYHKVWQWVDKAIHRFELFPDSRKVDQVLEALAKAKIVYVDILDIGIYESGTSEKWQIMLEGGQRAMMKLIWENKGRPKRGGLCNYGFELPTSEIAAFHLHRLLGFRNTPYVVGRKVNILKEILPVASPSVNKQIVVKPGNRTCIKGKCFFCKHVHSLCPTDGNVEASIALWVPRHLRLYTYPPKYMPFSTPREHEWGKIGFNNRSFCDKAQKIHPYEYPWYFLDLFDFAVLDYLMYHYDSKHYVVYDGSDAHGLTVRLDHGRAFCVSENDNDRIFMAPLRQCCTLRKTTWYTLKSLKKGELSSKLRAMVNTDPLAPILDESWYNVLERRLEKIKRTMQKCAKVNGGWDKVIFDG